MIGGIGYIWTKIKIKLMKRLTSLCKIKNLLIA